MKTLLLMVASFALGGVYVWWQLHQKATAAPDAHAVVQQMQDVARLETLDVTAYKKIIFTPDLPQSEGFFDDLVNWTSNVVRPAHGKAIVFARVHFALDLSKMTEHNVRIKGQHIWVVLPPLVNHTELIPADTEVIGSTLDSEQTAQLFENARVAFERDVGGNAELQQKARDSASRAIAAVLTRLGFTEVDFVSELPGFTFD